MQAQVPLRPEDGDQVRGDEKVQDRQSIDLKSQRSRCAVFVFRRTEFADGGQKTSVWERA